MLKETYKCILILISLLLIDTIRCDTKSDVENGVNKLQETSRRLYGEPQERSIKEWELDLEDPTSYPNGDGTKLAMISHTWINYYRCTSRVVGSMTSSGHLPGANVAVYEGEVARLPCGLCAAPGESDRVAWFYSQSTQNVTFTPLNDRSSIICGVNMTIYNVEARDAGLYRCQLASSVGGIIVLEVLHDDNYKVIDSDSYYRNDAAVRPTSTSELITCILWSPWSECSANDGAGSGSRRRFGMCYVRMNNKPSVTGKVSHSIFQEFPNGISCGSWLLPSACRIDPTIADRNNFIMTELCKTPCNQVFEVRSKTGDVLERANNSAGVFSLCQSPPPQPPPPVREVIFAKYGDGLTLKCAGTTLRDIPITWRRGNQLAERTVFMKPENRVHLTARNQIIFASVEDDDTDIYSCWQSTALAGVTKLEVWRDVRLANGRAAAAGWLAAIAIVLYYAVRLLRYKIRHGP